MSVHYEAVTWNRYKKVYDLIILGGVILYLAAFILLNRLWFPEHNANTVLIRAFGTLSILLLHLILAIGPAARLNSTWLPLLYNRRHLGVITFLVAAAHGTLSLVWFHGGGDAHPIISLFTANTHYDSWPLFPFEILGAAALLIMFCMAATSHDLWLSFLGPRAWKVLHMFVYLAYLLLIAHVSLGILQFEQSPWLVVALALGMATLTILHLMAAWKGRRDGNGQVRTSEGWVNIGAADSFVEGRAKVVDINGERIAVFNNKGALSAVHNVCKHQMGPLGEGRIVDGCITCPWHGFQYRPEDGCAPPPFHEKLHTYRLKREGDGIFLHPEALPEGTAVEPVPIDGVSLDKNAGDGFFVGWNGRLMPAQMRAPGMFAAGFLVLMLCLATLFVHEQHRVSPFRMDYDHLKEIDGWLTASPVPMIRVPEGQNSDGSMRFKDILLSDAGKFGADTTVSLVLGGRPMRHVKLKGYISQRIEHCGGDSVDCGKPCTQCLTGTNDYPVMEIGEARTSAFQLVPGDEPFPGRMGTVGAGGAHAELTGEIVDPKCYFGAMNPGEGKTHLSCAARCLSGGIMPVLKWRESDGEHFAVLVGAQGEAINASVSMFTGMRVRVSGQRNRMDNWELLRVTDIQEAAGAAR